MISSFKGFVWIGAIIVVILINANAECASEFVLNYRDQPAPSSIHPPFGNSLFLSLNASGVLRYVCQKGSNGKHVYKMVSTMATLYSPGHGTYKKAHSVGYRYDLVRALAEGGRPTFSFNLAEGDPMSAVPESTVTVIVITTRKQANNRDIDDALFKATSHSGHGHASEVAYVQRLHSKGGVPPSYCKTIGKTLIVPFSTQYFFWSQDRFLPLGIPAEISVSQHFAPLLSYYSEGYQHYVFNGTSWIDVNATSFLYSSPGQEVVGRHYYLTQPDQNGGQPSWELFSPLSRVTTKVVNTITVDKNSVDWSLLEATSYSGERKYYGEVKYVQRISTVGGLPPPVSYGSPKPGDKYLSPFSTVYWLYVDEQ